MKKLIIYIGFMFWVGPVIGQEIEGAIESQEIPMIQAIQRIENSTGKKFYFRNEWIEQLTVNESLLENTDFESQIEALLSSSTLDYYLEGESVILLQNTSIITQPAIASFFDDTQEIDESEIIFSKEQNSSSQSTEEKINVIGVRSRFESGGKSTVAGYIKDAQSGDPVEGAFVYSQTPYVGTSTDADGFYSLTLPTGKNLIFIQSINMKNTSRNLMLYSDGKLDVNLDVDVIALNAVVVNANREVNVQSPQMGLSKIDPESLKIVPALLGEKDLIRVSTTTAGVQYLGEGSAGINIRGGKADQNLFLFDGTPIYNTNHFFGFFSVFNSDALSGMDLYKSSIPTEYGGRLSSVFDVKTKKPNESKFSGNGGIGPVTSRLILETPIGEKGPSVMVGGRATYSDYVLNQIKDSPLKNNDAGFYDVVSTGKRILIHWCVLSRPNATAVDRRVLLVFIVMFAELFITWGESLRLELLL